MVILEKEKKSAPSLCYLPAPPAWNRLPLFTCSNCTCVHFLDQHCRLTIWWYCCWVWQEQIQIIIWWCLQTPLPTATSACLESHDSYLPLPSLASISEQSSSSSPKRASSDGFPSVVKIFMHKQRPTVLNRTKHSRLHDLHLPLFTWKLVQRKEKFWLERKLLVCSRGFVAHKTCENVEKENVLKSEGRGLGRKAIPFPKWLYSTEN